MSWTTADPRQERERGASMFMQIERRVLMLDDRDAFNGRNINFIQRVEVERQREREKKRVNGDDEEEEIFIVPCNFRSIVCVSFAYFYDFFPTD